MILDEFESLICLVKHLDPYETSTAIDKLHKGRGKVRDALSDLRCRFEQRMDGKSLFESED